MNEVWTDGACEPNPGIGGWGYTMRRDDGCQVEDCGGNERADQLAALGRAKAMTC